MMLKGHFHLVHIIMCQQLEDVGRGRGVMGLASTPPICTILSVVTRRREEEGGRRFTILLQYKRGGGRWLGGGAEAGQGGEIQADPQLAPVLVEPTYGGGEGSPKQQWPLHNGLLMGRSSGMDCIRAGLNYLIIETTLNCHSQFGSTLCTTF